MMKCYEFNDKGGIKFWVAAMTMTEACSFVEAHEEDPDDFTVSLATVDVLQRTMEGEDEYEMRRTMGDVVTHAPDGPAFMLAHTEA